jgi:hypothetical protein
MKVTSRIAMALTICFLVSPAQAGEGHDAGYSWAAEKGIDDPDNCYSASGEAINNSPSFTEGCLEYLQENGITNEDDEPIDEDDEDAQ